MKTLHSASTHSSEGNDSCSVTTNKNMKKTIDLHSGHVMLALRIGDCIITLLHLNEPIMPSQSTFDTNMRKWHYAYSITGNQGKQTLMQRRMIEGL